MKPLALSQRVLTWFCVCPDETSIKWQKFAYVAFTATSVTSLIFCYIPSIVAVFEFLSIDLESSFYALFQVSALSASLYNVIFVYFSRQRVNAIFENLTAIYNKCNVFFSKLPKFQFESWLFYSIDAREDWFKFLLNADNKSKWMWMIYLKFVVGGFLISTVAASMMSVLFQWKMHGNVDLKYLFHPYVIV